MFSPYSSNSRYESDYACICIVINGKIRSVPLNLLSSVFRQIGKRINTIGVNLSSTILFSEYMHIKRFENPK